jgi:sporulation protein YabP
VRNHSKVCGLRKECNLLERRMEDKTRMIHKVYLNARKSAVLSGVRDVLSFDAKEVYLETEQGVLLIQGDELHVNRLSLEKGEIDIDGRIDSFAYSDREETQKKAASFLSRMFQ